MNAIVFRISADIIVQYVDQFLLGYKLTSFAVQEKVLHVSDLDDATLVRLCRLYLTDYCCFDMELPEACIRAAASAAGLEFRSTSDVCNHMAINTLWGGTSAGEGFFDPVPEPQRSPHMYAGAANVVRSYHDFMGKIVH